MPLHVCGARSCVCVCVWHRLKSLGAIVPAGVHSLIMTVRKKRPKWLTAVTIQRRLHSLSELFVVILPHYPPVSLLFRLTCCDRVAMEDSNRRGRLFQSSVTAKRKPSWLVIEWKTGNCWNCFSDLLPTVSLSVRLTEKKHVGWHNRIISQANGTDRPLQCQIITWARNPGSGCRPRSWEVTLGSLIDRGVALRLICNYCRKAKLEGCQSNCFFFFLKNRLHSH